MAACKTCGRPAGMFASQCSDCKARDRAAHEAAVAAARHQAAAQREAALATARDAYVGAALSVYDDTAAQGQTIYLTRTLYIQVDSIVTGDEIGSWEPEVLTDLGLEGWAVVGIIPRTFGSGLTNKSYGSTMGETWGGGMGGNVMGVYVVMQMAVPAQRAAAIRPQAQMFYEELAGRQYS